jgi:hypothetical protein
MFSEGNAAHSVGCDCPLLIEMALGALFLNLNFMGWVWQPAADYNGCLVGCKFKNSATNGINICSRLSHTTDHHSKEKLAEGKRAVKAEVILRPDFQYLTPQETGRRLRKSRYR